MHNLFLAKFCQYTYNMSNIHNSIPGNSFDVKLRKHKQYGNSLSIKEENNINGIPNLVCIWVMSRFPSMVVGKSIGASLMSKPIWRLINAVS